MGEKLLVMAIVLAAASHLCYRYLPRRWRGRGSAKQAGGCAVGCGACGGCPSRPGRDRGPD